MLATGTWDGDPVLAQRWNGTSDHIRGFPVSYGYPVWFILPVWQNESLLDAGVLSKRITPARLSHARRHLGLPDPTAPAAS